MPNQQINTTFEYDLRGKEYDAEKNGIQGPTEQKRALFCA